MYPVFIIGRKIAFVQNMYMKGNHIKLGADAFLTKFGLFIPLEERAFAILEHMDKGWRGMNSDFRRLDGLLMTSSGVLKHISLQQHGTVPQGTPVHDMWHKSNDEKHVIYDSYNKSYWKLDETIIPRSSAFSGCFAEQDNNARLGNIAIEIAEGDIGKAVEAYLKTSPTGPAQYTIFDLDDAVKWLDENLPSRALPWFWKRKALPSSSKEESPK